MGVSPANNKNIKNRIICGFVLGARAVDKKVNRRVAVVNRPSSSTQSGGLWVLEPISWSGVFIIHVDDSCLLRLSVGVGVVRGIG